MLVFQILCSFCFWRLEKPQEYPKIAEQRHPDTHQNRNREPASLYNKKKKRDKTEMIRSRREKQTKRKPYLEEKKKKKDRGTASSEQQEMKTTMSREMTSAIRSLFCSSVAGEDLNKQERRNSCGRQRGSEKQQHAAQRSNFCFASCFPSSISTRLLDLHFFNPLAPYLDPN
jgi:hypothetical protein